MARAVSPAWATWVSTRRFKLLKYLHGSALEDMTDCELFHIGSSRKGYDKHIHVRCMYMYYSRSRNRGISHKTVPPQSLSFRQLCNSTCAQLKTGHHVPISTILTASTAFLAL